MTKKLILINAICFAVLVSGFLLYRMKLEADSRKQYDTIKSGTVASGAFSGSEYDQMHQLNEKVMAGRSSLTVSDASFLKEILSKGLDSTESKNLISHAYALKVISDIKSIEPGATELLVPVVRQFLAMGKTNSRLAIARALSAATKLNDSSMLSDCEAYKNSQDTSISTASAGCLKALRGKP